jgi:hypothetical protein
MSSTTEHQTEIRVRVAFPISKKGPLTERFPPEAIAETVRVAAMAHFAVTDDAQFAYVLTHDGQRQEPTTTLGEIAGDDRKVEFRLVKVITQGSTADAETVLNLTEQEGEVADFLALHDGRPTRDEIDSSIYWLDMRPRAAPEERYCVRIAWRTYPHGAPSVLFADGMGGALGVAHAWPQIPGYRAPNDICKPFTAEGFELHAEWGSGPDAWPTQGNPFLWVVETLQYDLDNAYSGRVE